MDFLKKMLSIFPQNKSAVENMNKTYGKILETVAMEDLFVPCIIDMLVSENDSNEIQRVFDLIENELNENDKHSKNLIQTTILECLGNDRSILKKAQKYMGSKTKEMQLEADRQLGRIM